MLPRLPSLYLPPLWSLALWLLVGGGFMAWGLPGEGPAVLGSWELRALLIGAWGLGTWLLLQPLWWLAGRPARSDWVFGLAVGGMLASLALVAHFGFRELGAREAALERHQRLLELQVRRPAFIDDAIAQARDARFAQYAARLDPVSLQRLRQIDAVSFAPFDRAHLEYEKAVRNAPTLLQLLTATDVAQLRGYRAQLTPVAEAVRAVQTGMDDFAPAYTRALEQSDLASEARRFGEAERVRITQTWAEGGIRRQFELEAAVCAELIGATDLLIETWGTWRFDAQIPRFSTDNRVLEARIAEAFSRAEQYVAEMRALNAVWQDAAAR